MCCVHCGRERDGTSYEPNSLGKRLVSGLGGKELNHVAAVGDLGIHSDQSLVASKQVEEGRREG